MPKYEVEGRGGEDMNNEPKQPAPLSNFCFCSLQQLGWRSLLSLHTRPVLLCHESPCGCSVGLYSHGLWHSPNKTLHGNGKSSRKSSFSPPSSFFKLIFFICKKIEELLAQVHGSVFLSPELGKLLGASGKIFHSLHALLFLWPFRSAFNLFPEKPDFH